MLTATYLIFRIEQYFVHKINIYKNYVKSTKTVNIYFRMLFLTKKIVVNINAFCILRAGESKICLTEIEKQKNEE